MKVITTTTTKLSDHDFNVLTKKIVNAIYDIEPEIADVYEVYINIVNDEWVVNFSPKIANVPLLKVNAYTSYDTRDREHLEIQPIKLEKFPNILNISTYDRCIDVSELLVTLSNFVVGLSDFSYILS